MSREIDNSELYMATIEVVKDTFNQGAVGIESVDTSLTDIVGLDDFVLGSISNGTGNVKINLGSKEVKQFIDYFSIMKSEEEKVYRYIAASMFAGYIVESSVVGRTDELSEASEFFNQELIDVTRPKDLLEDCAWRSFGTPGAPGYIYQDMIKRGPIEIATFNMYGIGSGIVLLAEEEVGNKEALEVSDLLVSSLNETIQSTTANDQLTFRAAGLVQNDAQAKIGKSIMERLIKQRGLGLAFPYTKTEIHKMQKGIHDAKKVGAIREKLLREEHTSDMGETKWRQLVELSNGYPTVDKDRMHVEE